jgi:AraC-like DNA-binding protein
MDWQGCKIAHLGRIGCGRPTPQTVIEEIERLRRQRWTGKQIAAQVGVSPATVSRVLRQLGLNKLNALEPAEPVRRYECENPGELIHIDIKKLGRIGLVGHRITGRQTGVVNRHLGIGWEYVHVCIDDASRVAFVQSWPISGKRAPSHSSRPQSPITATSTFASSG